MLTLANAVVLAVLLWACVQALRDTSYVTGWALLLMVLFLAAYNVRKKLTYPPLMKSSTWLQLHIYVALLSAVIFGFHTGFRVPNGVIEVGLASLYLLTFLSGLCGLFLSRAIPPRLAVRGPEVLFERIPMLRRELRKKAEDLVIESVEKTNATTLSDFYADRLAVYFARPHDIWLHLWQSRKPLHRLQGELAAYDRYLGDEERAIA
ncbi:MAG: hypothetical protein ACYTGQ_10120, partial [Planctomycetota bacterium]